MRRNYSVNWKPFRGSQHSEIFFDFSDRKQYKIIEFRKIARH